MVIAALGAVILIAHFLEGITGFGCTVIALPFCIALIGVKTAVPILTILGWLLALTIVIMDREKIVKNEYLKILGFVILGLPIGIFLFASLPEAPLKILLGIFMVAVAVGGLVTNVTSIRLPFTLDTKLGACLMNFMLFLGGIIHGAFSSGGPFIVVYATKKLQSKGAFRATLSAIWLTLNSIIIAANLIHGSYSTEVLKTVLVMLPFLLAGMIAGNIAHKKIESGFFSKLVYSVLLISGVFMFA